MEDGFKHLIIQMNDYAREGTYKFRRDLETDNWHYYEKRDGKLLHIRKDKMVCVDEV